MLKDTLVKLMQCNIQHIGTSMDSGKIHRPKTCVVDAYSKAWERH